MKMHAACCLLTIVPLLPTAAHAAWGSQLAKLTASDGAAGDHFGRAVAISGNMAVVGAYRDRDNGYESGSAYLFDTSTGSQLAKLLPADGERIERFGGSVAISGNTAVVGAALDDDRGDASGSVYLFDITTGSQLAKLTASDAAARDLFGISVGISGNTAIVGAYLDDDSGNGSGSAYLFDITTGSQLAKLTASDAAAGDRFGVSVAISGNTAIVGANQDDDHGAYSGSAYLFDITTGSQLAKLTASDAAADDQFGGSVAISGNIAVVGAFGDDNHGLSSGSAYLFDISTGSQLAKLTAIDESSGDFFGSSVAISGDTVIVGAPGDVNGRGSAYLFDITTGSQVAKLTSRYLGNGRFGESVAISGNTTIVGEYLDYEIGANSGSAYLFSVVPEPTALLLGVLSVGSILLCRRRPDQTMRASAS